MLELKGFTMNMQWLYLAIAIVSEVVATSALKAADGFTRWEPMLLVVAGYTLAFYFLSLALRTIQLGVAYAIWPSLSLLLNTAFSVLPIWKKDEHYHARDNERDTDE